MTQIIVGKFNLILHDMGPLNAREQDRETPSTCADAFGITRCVVSGEEEMDQIHNKTLQTGALEEEEEENKNRMWILGAEFIASVCIAVISPVKMSLSWTANPQHSTHRKSLQVCLQRIQKERRHGSRGRNASSLH